jgi:O-antigen ligase
VVLLTACWAGQVRRATDFAGTAQIAAIKDQALITFKPLSLGNSDMTEIASTPWWESKLARRLDYVAVLAAIAIVYRLALEEDVSWTAWVILGLPIVLLSLIRWPYGAISVLVGMSAMPRFSVQVGGWKARPEHFAVLIVSAATGVRFLRHQVKMRLEGADYWILAYVAINYLGSAFGSSDPSSTLRWALLNNLVVLPYFLIRLFVTDLETLRKAFRIFLAVGVVESAYGILCFASNHLFGTTAGMEVGAYLVDVAAPYGSLYEPNLFGAYAGCCAVLFLALYIGDQRRFGSLACFLIALLATILSYSRAALLALVVTVCWVFWKARPRRGEGKRILANFALPIVLILVVAVLTSSGGLQERFSNMFNEGLTETTTISRFIEMQAALQDIPSHPLLGSGTASIQLSFDWASVVPEWAGNTTWIGNVTLRILHDTGLFGLATLFGFFISIWRKLRHGLRPTHSQRSMLVGLTAGVLLYGISFQATDGTILAFTWVHLGFLASAAVMMGASNESVNGVHSPVQTSI